MALIYIDTNVYLDFYQSATDRLSTFEELVKYANKIIVTEQTTREFLRNRVLRLAILAKEVDKSVSGQFYTTAIVRGMEEYEKIVEHQKAIKSLAASVTKRLGDWREGRLIDPVFGKFDELTGKAHLYATSDAAFEKAKRRKIIGDPPTSPDKYTVGDELIWETILESCEEDLIIVSRDQTFSNNYDLLCGEYNKITGKTLIKITNSLSEALKLLGEESGKLQQAEKEVEKSIEIDARLLGNKCPKCGGELEETGFEGGDGDSAWWVFCTRCAAEFFPK